MYKAVEFTDSKGVTGFKLDPTTEITTLSFVGTNLGAQADVKGKRGVIKQGNNGQSTPAKTIKYKKDPLGIL